MPHKEERKFSCICFGYLTCYEEEIGSTAYWQHKGAHALLGCAVGAAKAGDCQSGAAGAVISQIILSATALGIDIIAVSLPIIPGGAGAILKAKNAAKAADKATVCFHIRKSIARRRSYKVKNFKGPPNSAIRGQNGRVFITNNLILILQKIE